MRTLAVVRVDNSLGSIVVKDFLKAPTGEDALPLDQSLLDIEVAEGHGLEDPVGTTLRDSSGSFGVRRHEERDDDAHPGHSACSARPGMPAGGRQKPTYRPEMLSAQGQDQDLQLVLGSP
ncbi:hypothetical protein [Streptomyces sp. NPDC059072]|uniref:hypothetical protein n=1 Tax=Streptomyces sp. NPDC059072 TaxID=3346715 RepID=UPI00368B2A97